MHPKQTKWQTRWSATIVVALGWLLASGLAHAAAPKQKTFASPEEAITALVEAVKTRKSGEALAILGTESKSWLASGDSVADRTAGEQFVMHYEQKHVIEQAGNRAVMSVGRDDWPFPIPLVNVGDRWHFDTAAGKEEILARRIGKNELSAIEVMRAIVDAEREYAAADRDDDGLLAYAQKFGSGKGKRDGLYWPVKDGEPLSPLGPLVAKAESEGYPPGGGAEPYHGYYFKIIRSQGKNAPGGAFDYVVRGKMIGGFAVVAFPAKYAVSGVMTFMVNQDGEVYQKNLGPNTAQAAKKITKFDPDNTWSKP
jgi:DUF2950 family protein